MSAIVDLWRRPRPVVGLHLAALAVLFLGLGLVVSAVVDAIDGGPDVGPLLLSAVLLAAPAAVVWRLTTTPERLDIQAAFVAVTVTWLVVVTVGAVPYLVTGTFESWDTALFESVTGFTGAGSTVLSPIEGTSAGVLMWRSLTHWYGGMGVVVLAVAVLPFLGVGGLELISAEAPGQSSERLAPRMAETAKRLWLLYAGITAVFTALLMVVGMSPFDAVNHAMSGVATVGLGTYDDSIAHFDSVAVEVVLMVLMIVGATSFTLHWRAALGRPQVYWRSSEFRLFAGMLVAGTLLVWGLNVSDGQSIAEALRVSSFTFVSILTSTGFLITDYTEWVVAAQLLLGLAMLVGGMTGSTTGGIKQLRVLVLLRAARLELVRARYPSAVLPVRLGGDAIPDRTVERMAGFVLLYVVVLALGALAIAALGADVVTAGSAAIASLGLTGPGFGRAGPAFSYLEFARPARAVIMSLMLLGRLELFAIIVVLASLGRRSRSRLAR